MKLSLADKARLFFLSPLILIRWYQYYHLTMANEGILRNLPIITLVVIVMLVAVIIPLDGARRKGQIAKTGVFAVVAHPAYTTYFILDICSLFWADLSPAYVVVGIFFWIALLWNAYLEERSLLRRFGEEARVFLATRVSLHLILFCFQKRPE